MNEEQAKLVGAKPISRNNIKDMIEIAKQIEFPYVEYNEDTNKMINDVVKKQQELGLRLKMLLSSFVDLPDTYYLRGK